MRRGLIVNYIFLHSIARWYYGRRYLRSAVISVCIALFMTRTRAAPRRLGSYDLTARREQEKEKRESSLFNGNKDVTFPPPNKYLFTSRYIFHSTASSTGAVQLDSFLYLTVASCKELKLNVTFARESLVFGKIHGVESRKN